MRNTNNILLRWRLKYMGIIKKTMVFGIIGLFLAGTIVPNVICEKNIIARTITKNDEYPVLKEPVIKESGINQLGFESIVPRFINSPPAIPLKPFGPTEGTIYVNYSYSTRSIDPDEDDIQYGFDIDNDGIVEENLWTNFYPSGYACDVDILFKRPGIYPLRVKARDIWGDESGFSDSLSIEIIYSGRTIHVPLNFPTIQEAVDNAYYSDTITVQGGYYYENIVINKTDEIPFKALNIIGENKENTVIEGCGSDAVIRICSDCINISDFTVRNGGPKGSYIGCGIHLGSNQCKIFNNIISENEKMGLFISGDNNTIMNNNISNNTKWGIYVINSNYNLLYHNNFMNNGEYNAWEVYSYNNNAWYNTLVLEGNYWDDYNGLDDDGNGIGDTPYGIAPYSDVNQDKYPYMNPIRSNPSPPLDPDLSCEGRLNWINVSPKTTVSSNFSVRNIGDAGSLLDWAIMENPDWGNWTFDPENGEDLKPEDGVITVTVYVEVPEKKSTKFWGSIIIGNIEKEEDTCEIPVSLSTPKTIHKIFVNNFIDRLITNVPILIKLLD